MPTLVAIPIKDRIMRQLLAQMNAVTAIGTARRWDARGGTNAQDMDAMVEILEETVVEGECGNPPYAECTMKVACGVLLGPREDGNNPTDNLVNRYQAQAENSLRANQFVIEDTSNVRLAILAHVVSRNAPELERGGVAAAVVLEVIYRHDGDDTTKYGTAISQTQEELTT